MDAPSLSDADLVAAARRGDKNAVAVLLTRHRPLLHALCVRMLCDPLLAEDAVQEASVRAMLGLEDLRSPDRFGSWLGGIGLNVCRAMLRDRSADPWSWEALCGGLLVDEPPDPHPGPESIAEMAELAERVRRAVEDLPGGQRAAVLLFYLSGLTYAETAVILGIEVNAVRTRLHKARRSLRQHLWETWKEESTMTETRSQPVDMRVDDVVVDESGEEPRQIILLQEVGGDRGFPIWIGRPEATAIVAQLQNIQLPRPLTASFAASLLEAAGARLREVRITRITNEVIYAVVALDTPQGEREIDARPSDAIALALILGAPIRAETEVLDQAAISGPRAGTATRFRIDPAMFAPHARAEER